MSVWVIYKGNYHPREVIAICATEAKARALLTAGEDCEEWPLMEENEHPGQALYVGDKMRFSGELLTVIKDQPPNDVHLVVVDAIERQPDRSVVLRLKHSTEPAQVGMD